MSSVAVIDIGSNSIKVLVATRARDGGIVPRLIRTIDARISAGISRADPRLSEEGMVRGVAAVRDLLAATDEFAPAQTLLVATSAVRGATNGEEFRERVRAATGHVIRILTGEEEANLIGRGLVADPALRHLRNFYVFDLGGGSLECLAFRERQIEQAISLPLGCVRLMERFVTDPTQSLTADARAAVMAHTREVIDCSGFRFSLPPGAAAVGTGGTVTTVRTVLGAPEGKSLEGTSPVVTREQVRTLLDRLGALTLAERKKIPGLPPARADVFPVALATLLAVAELGGFDRYENSLFNLRYGLAAELLSSV